MKTLYGKNRTSAKKIQAAKMFEKCYSKISSIANLLAIEIPTAEVYIIDAYCTGAPVSIEKLASELKIHNPNGSANVAKISRLIEEALGSLRQIKDAVEGQFSYNQVKVVLAAIIRDELYKII